jgi:hypothetical protein
LAALSPMDEENQKTQNFNSRRGISGAFAYSRKAPITFVMSVHLPACINTAPTGQIFVQFGIGDLYENLSGNSKIG